MKKKELLEIVNDVDILYRDELDISSDISFGMEVEYTNLYFLNLINLLEKFNLDWKYVLDISVSNTHFGGELTSPIMYNKKEYWEEIKLVLKMMKNFNAGINDDCAAHIHVGSDIYGEDIYKYYYMLKTWAIFEKEIMQFGYGEFDHLRENYRIFSIPIRSEVLAYDTLIKIIINDNISFLDKIKEISDYISIFRNTSINLDNIKDKDIVDKNTIEIRVFNGTLNPVIWQNNINFVIHFLDYFNKDYDKEIIDYYFKKSRDNKLDLNKYDIDKGVLLGNLIFDNDIDNLYYLKQYTRGLKK